MRVVPPELAAALTAPERVLTPRVRCDWDGDGFNGNGTVDDIARALSTLQIDQVLTSNVPSVAQPVAGAAVGQLTADVEQGHLFGSVALPVVRGITSSTAATGTGLISVTRGPVQPGDTVFVWIANAGEQFYVYTNGMNVAWNTLMTSGDTNSTFTHVITGRLLSRRVGVTLADVNVEPSTYTFNVISNPAWVAHCVVVASGYTPGVHAFTRRGGDPVSRRDDTYGSLVARPITTTLDNCLLLSFFAGYAAPGGGVSWTADSPAVELADLCSSGGRDNIATCVTQITNVAAGLYTPSATISASTEPGVVAVVALAPSLAGDETQNAAWVYSELNGGSPIAGKTRLARPLTAQLDVATTAGVQSVPLFTGQSLGVDVSSRARKATFTALDNRELMRGDPNQLTKLGQSAVIAENPAIAFGETLPTFPGLDATWLVSYIFSYCRVGLIGDMQSRGATTGDGFFASPPPRTSTILHVPCHGSLEPFIGTTQYAYQLSSTGTLTRPSFSRGPWVASVTPTPVGGKVDAKWFNDSSFFSSVWNHDFTGNASSKGRIECYLQQSIAGKGTATLGVTGRSDATQFCFLDLLTTGQVQLRLSMPGGITRTVAGPTLPADQAWHAVGVHWDAVTGSATFRIDSTDTVVGFATFTATITDNSSWGFGTLTDGVALAELQICGGYPLVTTLALTNFIKVTDSWAWQNFTPTAFIDRSDNLMDSTLAVDVGTDCYALLSEIADAEFAAVYFDADGHPHYRTRYSDYTTVGQTVQRTLTTLNGLKDVDYQSGVDQLANSIAVPFTPVDIRDNVLVWQPSSPLRIPANSTAYQINVTIPGLRNTLIDNTFVVGNANTRPDGLGVVVGGVNITAQAVGTNATIFLGNGNAFDVWMVDTSGNPTISWSAGIVQSGSATLGTTVTNSDSIRLHGTQGITNGVSDNRWRQRQDTADGLARVLLSDLAAPSPVLTNITVVGDPRLEIGDLVRFVDKDGLGFDGSYRLVGISPSYSTDQGFTQTLVARQTNCGVGVWDVTYWDDCHVWGP